MSMSPHNPTISMMSSTQSNTRPDPVATPTMTVRAAMRIHSFLMSSLCILSIVLISLLRRSTFPVRLSSVSVA